MIIWLVSICSSLMSGHSAPLAVIFGCSFGLIVILTCTLIDKVRSIIFNKLGITAFLDNLGKKIDLKLALTNE